MATLNTDEARAEPATASVGRSPGGPRLARYLALVLVIPALFYPFPFLIATSASYEHWATAQWTPMLEYTYDVRGQNADVVIFGDSSAFIGIDPHRLNAELGVQSVVLPDTVGSLPVTDDGPLKAYLAHNAAPKLLVLYFTAWDLDFTRIATFRRFEGEEMLLRHGSRGEIARFALRHPTEMLVFPFRLYSTFGPKMIRAALHHVNREQGTAEALGHADYNLGFPPLGPSCTLPAEYRTEAGAASVEALVQRYTTPTTRVLVYLAPLPDCKGSAEVTGRSYAALGAAPPRTLPARFFADDPYYAHILPPHVPDATEVLADALKAQLDLRKANGPASHGASTGP